MQRDDVGHAQQLVQAADLHRVAQRQLGHGVVEEHLHAQGLGEYRELGADRAVADDAELLATDLEGIRRADVYKRQGSGCRRYIDAGNSFTDS